MAQDTRFDGWNLWAKSLIGAAIAEERKAMADCIGKIIAEERARPRAEHVELTIEIAAVQAEIAMLKAVIAELKAGRPAVAEGAAEVVPPAAVRH